MPDLGRPMTMAIQRKLSTLARTLTPGTHQSQFNNSKDKRYYIFSSLSVFNSFLSTSSVTKCKTLCKCKLNWSDVLHLGTEEVVYRYFLKYLVFVLLSFYFLVVISQIHEHFKIMCLHIIEVCDTLKNTDILYV